MITVGITGIIGSGKTTVSKMLQQRGLAVIDLDGLAKKAITLKGVQEDIIARIGKEYVKNGKVSVEKLGDLVFAEKNMLQELENIIHPSLIEELRKELKRLRVERAQAAIVDAPLLYEKGLYKDLDRVVVVSAETNKIKERLKARGLSEEDIKRRTSFQIPLKEKERMADFVIHNNGTRENLERAVDVLMRRIKEWEVVTNAP